MRSPWGKVRLRGEPKAGSYWRDYKAIRLNSTYYGAFFDDNQSLIDYVNSQPLLNPLVCLADGHQGVWNLIEEFGTDQQRWEILDWYHLKENLYKVGGSLKRRIRSINRGNSKKEGSQSRHSMVEYDS